MPALPLDEAGKYVAAAYIVFLALILIYVGIMAAKLGRIQDGLSEIADAAERKRDEEQADHDGAAAAPGQVQAKSHEVEVVAEEMRR